MPHILIVDDSFLTRRHLCRTLHEVGYQTTQAADGDEAIALLADSSYDCILLDMLMPHVTGHEVLGHLRAIHSTIPVIVLTADIQDTTREACMSEGAFRVLNKPPEKGALLEAVASALKGADG